MPHTFGQSFAQQLRGVAYKPVLDLRLLNILSDVSSFHMISRFIFIRPINLYIAEKLNEIPQMNI